MSLRNRIPRARNTIIVLTALRNYVPSTPPVLEERRSERGTPNLRYNAESNGLPWYVDIYLGHYYRVRVGSRTGEVFRTIPALIGYLVCHLGIVSREA